LFPREDEATIRASREGEVKKLVPREYEKTSAWTTGRALSFFPSSRVDATVQMLTVSS
jgi:hypothetical protein